MDGGREAGLRILLQLALDEMRNVWEAVGENHDTKRSPQKYGTPYSAINGMHKVREDILVQAAMWGIELQAGMGEGMNRFPEPDEVIQEVLVSIGVEAR